MTDVIVIVAIIAFFGICAVLVRVLDRMIERSRSSSETGFDEELP